MCAPTSTVFVVDDDVSARGVLESLLLSAGFNVLVFESVTQYLAAQDHCAVSCLLVDIDLPDVPHLELSNNCNRKLHPPVIFTARRADLATVVGAMRSGAVDFLLKPFDEHRLLVSIRSALESHVTALHAHHELRALKARYDALTPREREVMTLLVNGLLNKQAAATLGISEVTLQIHRGHIMRKMKARTFASLVKMSIRLGIEADDDIQEPLVSMFAKALEEASQLHTSIARQRRS